ncbi:type II CRISPR RNA-guided endonuclease Cas9 [Clostridium perfringens]
MRILGLDIGSSTVGVGLLDVTDNKIDVVHASTRIFPSVIKEDNSNRRARRGNRRRIRRRNYRVNKKLKKLLGKYKIAWTNDFTMLDKNPYELRSEALFRRLSDLELVRILTNYLKHRGVDYIEEVDESESEKLVYIKDSEFVCHNILERMNKFNDKLISGQAIFKNNEIGILNGSTIYIRKDILREIEAVLSKQIELNNNLDDYFKDYFINEIFSKKREYYEGPGDVLNRTNYGIYREDKDSDGNYITWDNLFENLVGNCSIYPDKKRAPRLSYTAQEFNFLNDLNNLRLGDRKITTEEKEKLMSVALSGKTLNLKTIAKICNISTDEINGYRKDSKGVMELEKFQQFLKVQKKISSKSLRKSEFNIIANILTLEGRKEAKIAKLCKKLNEYTREECELIYDVVSKMGAKDKGWHSLSYEAMEDIIPELWNEPKNQSQLFAEKGMFKIDLQMYKDKKSIPIRDISENLLNPIIKRSFIQTCKIVELVFKKYGPIDKIVIELARDLYTDPKVIKKEQNENRRKNEEAVYAIKKFAEENGIPYSEKDITKKSILKYKLWKEQNGLCVYSLKPISIDTLMLSILKKNVFLLEVDHIFPISISFDDSQSNKVLVYREENQAKGQRTPYQYYSSQSKFDEFEKFVNSNNNFAKKKKEYLLMKENLYKYDIRKDFINRNLVDTRGASRLVLNVLQKYFKANNINTKISVVRGQYTAITRNNMKIKKDRYEHKNHAVDALIAAISLECRGIKDSYLAKKALEFECDWFEDSSKDCIDILGEDIKRVVASKDDSNRFVQNRLGEFKNAILNAEYKYSHRVDKKLNRAITNKETIRGTREYNNKKYTVFSYSDIYDLKSDAGKKLAENLRSCDETKYNELLVYKHDFKTFEILKNIAVNMYDSTVENPFAKYKEEFGFIRKYSAKNNGPVIKNIKYIKGAVGNCLDLSHKVGCECGSKKSILTDLPSYRVDIYNDGERFYMLEVPRVMFEFKKGKYILNIQKYLDNKFKKNIPAEAKFKFSLYKGDQFYIKRRIRGKDGYMEGRYKMLSVNNGSENKLEFDTINFSLKSYNEYVKDMSKKSEGFIPPYDIGGRIVITVNESILEWRKEYTDILGNIYPCFEEKLVSEFKL